MTTRVAACACGQVRLECEGEPALVAICGCTACQKRTGSAYGVSAFFPSAQVKSIEGTVKEFRRTSDAGRAMRSRFCPECGSTVYWEGEFRPGHIGVAVGAFADAAFPKPTVAVWAQKMCEWVALPVDIRVFPEWPPSR